MNHSKVRIRIAEAVRVSAGRGIRVLGHRKANRMKAKRARQGHAGREIAEKHTEEGWKR